jgi:hypothetical protein
MRNQQISPNDRQIRSTYFCSSTVFDSSEVCQKRLEVLVKDGVNWLDIEDKDNDEETNEKMTPWTHRSHLVDNKLLNNNINNFTGDIGKCKDWSISGYKERWLTTINGKEYLKQIPNMSYKSKESTGTPNTLKIPKTKDEKEYSIESLAPEQKAVVLAVMYTIIKFLQNKKRMFRSVQLLWDVEGQESSLLLIPY